MLERSFNGLTMIQKSLDATWLKNDAISNNIANVNTPGYKRDIVEFESVLKEALSGSTLEGKMTRDKHIPLGRMNPDNVHAQVKKDLNTKYRKDGNNVNIDVEMANLAKNTINYNMMAQRISGKLGKLKQVIRDGR